MLLLSICAALARETPDALALPPPPETGFNQAIGLTEGILGPIVWISGYTGFGLAEYSARPQATYPVFAGVMGVGFALSTDGWARFSAARRWKKGALKGQDLLELESRFNRHVAIADFAGAGVMGVIGGSWMILSPIVANQPGGRGDAGPAATSGGVLLIEGLALAGVGMLHWFTPGAPMASVSLRAADGRLNPTMELAWSW
ncbi:MAG TPA: hypothetical protein PLA94_10275 [Myxococcota bacterium]|nr:hypothetical protein [Myxococcota bacterium]